MHFVSHLMTHTGELAHGSKSDDGIGVCRLQCTGQKVALSWFYYWTRTNGMEPTKTLIDKVFNPTAYEGTIRASEVNRHKISGNYWYLFNRETSESIRN